MRLTLRCITNVLSAIELALDELTISVGEEYLPDLQLARAAIGHGNSTLRLILTKAIDRGDD